MAPNAKLRPLVVPQGSEVQKLATDVTVAGECAVQTVQARPQRISWARLLKRDFDIDMHTCPNCGGGELKIIAAILEWPVIEKILIHFVLDPQAPPRGAGARGGAGLKPPEHCLARAGLDRHHFRRTQRRRGRAMLRAQWVRLRMSANVTAHFGHRDRCR